MSAQEQAAIGATHGGLLATAKQGLRSILPQSVLNWKEARYFGKYGEVELHLMDLLCRRESDAIDIGANNGCYIFFMLPHCRRVHAFEPLPELAADLRRKFGDRIVFHPIALSRARGTAELQMPIVDGHLVTGCATVSAVAGAVYPAHRSITVPVERLDDVYNGDVGFIKIDVEGHEQAVLDGAIRTIETSRPSLLLELEERTAPGGLDRALEFFSRLNYQTYFVHDHKFKPVSEFSLKDMQNPADLPDLTATLEDRQRFGRYIINFIFLPGEKAPALSAAIRNRVARL
jgi:FkbM family methyltransferase